MEDGNSSAPGAGASQESPAAPAAPVPALPDAKHEAGLRRWMKPECSATVLCLLASVFAVLTNNSRLFTELARRTGMGSVSGIACIVTVFLAVTGMVATVLLALGQRWLLKPALIALLFLSAGLGYFTDSWGTVFDQKMIRNIVDTFVDSNVQEATEVLSWRLLVRLTLLALLPGVVILRTKVVPQSLRRDLLHRCVAIAGTALLIAILCAANYRYMVFFARENVRLKYYATPTYAIESLRKYVLQACRRERPFQVLGADAVQARQGRQRTIGIMVVGETARADHFSLNGYARKTNPRLEKRTLLNFPDTTSSGTSTSFSVPCMFSFLGKSRFSVEKAAAESNVLDVLHQAGVKVVWIDNNSSDKGVCKRIGYINLHHDPNPNDPHFSGGGYYDEVLLEGLESHLAGESRDVLIVLHTIGSHGPAYHLRYPQEFARFQPACLLDAPQDAAVEDVVNAYDNTILYTDHVLDRIITFLEGLEPSTWKFLYYVSDHGESLGENGVYLHGLPDALAPRAQTHVPMLIWMSDSLVDDLPDYEALRLQTGLPRSHDNVPHTLLGLYDVRTTLYREALDLLSVKRE